MKLTVAVVSRRAVLVGAKTPERNISEAAFHSQASRLECDAPRSDNKGERRFFKKFRVRCVYDVSSVEATSSKARCQPYSTSHPLKCPLRPPADSNVVLSGNPKETPRPKRVSSSSALERVETEGLLMPFAKSSH